MLSNDPELVQQEYLDFDGVNTYCFSAASFSKHTRPGIGQRTESQ